MKENPKNKNLKSWVKKLGLAGVLFFTAKGLVWLAVIYFGADLLNGCSQ